MPTVSGCQTCPVTTTRPRIRSATFRTRTTSPASRLMVPMASSDTSIIARSRPAAMRLAGGMMRSMLSRCVAAVGAKPPAAVTRSANVSLSSISYVAGRTISPSMRTWGPRTATKITSPLRRRRSLDASPLSR